MSGGAPGEQAGLERYDLSCVVDPHRAGLSLLDFLMARFRYHEQATWIDRIASGGVTINGRPAEPSAAVRAGDRVGYSFLHREPPVDFRYDVLHEDADLLAVAKSGNLPVHAAGRYIRHTLMARLRERWPPPLFLAYRLDRETSGVVLVARSRERARAIERLVQGRAWRKSYLAIVHGRMASDRIVDSPIARKLPARPPVYHVAEEGKAARTRFVPIDVGRLPEGCGATRVHGRDVTLVEVVPETGRTHQIRVHASHLGHPIVGDKVYAVEGPMAEHVRFEASDDELVTRLGASRQLLHCARVEVPFPAGDRCFQARCPDDFGVLVASALRAVADT